MAADASDSEAALQQPDDTASASNGGLSDEQHAWTSAFCQIDTHGGSAANSDDGAAAAGNGDAGAGGSAKAGDAGSDGTASAAAAGGENGGAADGTGGFLGTLANAAGSVVDAASDALHAGSDALSSAVQAVPTGAAADAAAAPAPAPTSSPGVLEEIEDAAVSGIRTIAKAAPAVAGGVALGPLLVAGAVGAAIMTWATDAGAAWDGETNPETGKPFGSQEEWDAYQAHRKQQQSGGNCDGLFKSVTDQLKLLEQLLEEAAADKQHLWELEQEGKRGPDGTTWSGHKRSYDKERKELAERIKRWEGQCPGMQLTPDQQEELEMAHDYADNDKFPDKPEYAK
jgi:hypothetical protein